MKMKDLKPLSASKIKHHSISIRNSQNNRIFFIFFCFPLYFSQLLLVL